MAEIINIKNEAGEVQYPVTKPECVIDENGKNVLQLIRENGSSSSYDDTELRERIEENEILIEDLQNTKIDKEADDYYPQLAVGLADNLAGVDVVDSEVNFRRSGGGAISDGVARIESIKGNSVVWNQMRGSANRQSLESSKGGISIQYNKGETLQNITGTYEGFDGDPNWYNAGAFNNIKGVIGHKYLCSIRGNKNTLMTIYGHGDSSVMRIKDSVIITAVTATNINIVPCIDTSMAIGTVVNENILFLCTDLTQMFGAGNEPTTIEEFYARKPMGIEDENAYNDGEVIHMDVQSIESQGVNAWDEEWEVGKISLITGQNDNQPIFIRSKNYIKVLPNTQYYINTPSANIWIAFLEYDKDYNFLRNRGSVIRSITTSADCAYIRFYVANSYGVTYNHDICINISDTSINGKYFPYIKRVEDLSIIRKYFPQGMKSAGTAHDEIRYNKASGKWEYSKGKIKSVDLGTLNWKVVATTQGGTRFKASISDIKPVAQAADQGNILCAKYDTITADGTYFKNKGIAVEISKGVSIYDETYTDAETLKDAMQGVIVYYESTDWEWVELDAEDQFKDLDYQVWNCGTEKAIAEGKSAPLAADITYGFNAIGKIKELESLVAQLRAKVGI